jgi:hypothetical protein
LIAISSATVNSPRGNFIRLKVAQSSFLSHPLLLKKILNDDPALIHPQIFLFVIYEMSALGLSGFSAALENRQTNRLEMKPIRQRSQRPLPKSRDSTAVASAPISETDVHCAHHHPI